MLANVVLLQILKYITLFSVNLEMSLLGHIMKCQASTRVLLNMKSGCIQMSNQYDNGFDRFTRRKSLPSRKKLKNVYVLVSFTLFL